jgi:hypothetical protein
MSSYATEGAPLTAVAAGDSATSHEASAPSQGSSHQDGSDQDGSKQDGPKQDGSGQASPAVGEQSLAPADAAPAGAVPAGAVPAGAEEVASAAAAGTTSPELAAADAGAMTIVLDPEPLPYYAGPPDAEPVSKLAIVALVTSVIALVPIAVPCAIAALVGIGRTGRRGRGMAVAALFASATWLIVGGAVGTVGALTHGFHKPVTIKYREAAVFKLRVGDCVDTPNGQIVSVMPCSQPHAAEVFATFPLPASAWPGAAAVAREASSGCVARLDGYLNPQLAISLAQSYVYPNRVAWTAGTRTVICEVRASSGKLTGSVRGAS